jgi:DNA-binding XRE family transcriptional regulator
MLTPRLDRVFIYTCNGKYSRKDIKRFIKYIRINKETGCWEWTGFKDKDGYGQFSITKNGRQIRIKSHRAAIEMATGILIPEGMCVCHKCDNPKCINVLICLFLGTHQDNMKDRDNKGRGNQVSGENHCRAKLTWDQINKIRKLYATGKYTQRKLAKMFFISHIAIGFIIRNEHWYDHNYIPTKFDSSHDHYRKLNQEQINTIRIDYAICKCTQQQLADKFNVNRATISLIINNKIHKEISANDIRIPSHNN